MVVHVKNALFKKKKSATHKFIFKNSKCNQVQKTSMRSGDAQTGYQRSRQKLMSKPESDSKIRIK